MLGTLVIIALCYVATPALIGWAWVLVHRQALLAKGSLWPSIAALYLASASAALAIGAGIYGRMIGGFAFYDANLMRILVLGALLSLAGCIFGLIGIARKSSLCWLAPASALGTLIFWIYMAGGQ